MAVYSAISVYVTLTVVLMACVVGQRLSMKSPWSLSTSSEATGSTEATRATRARQDDPTSTAVPPPHSQTIEVTELNIEEVTKSCPVQQETWEQFCNKHSCRDRCGVEANQFSGSTSCSCDSLCEVFNDCCYDYNTFCPKRPTSHPLVGVRSECLENGYNVISSCKDEEYPLGISSLQTFFTDRVATDVNTKLHFKTSLLQQCNQGDTSPISVWNKAIVSAKILGLQEIEDIVNGLIEEHEASISYWNKPGILPRYCTREHLFSVVCLTRAGSCEKSMNVRNVTEFCEFVLGPTLSPKTLTTKGSNEISESFSLASTGDDVIGTVSPNPEIKKTSGETVPVNERSDPVHEATDAMASEITPTLGTTLATRRRLRNIEFDDFPGFLSEIGDGNNVSAMFDAESANTRNEILFAVNANSVHSTTTLSSSDPLGLINIDSISKPVVSESATCRVRESGDGTGSIVDSPELHRYTVMATEGQLEGVITSLTKTPWTAIKCSMKQSTGMTRKVEMFWKCSMLSCHVGYFFYKGSCLRPGMLTIEVVLPEDMLDASWSIFSQSLDGSLKNSTIGLTTLGSRVLEVNKAPVFIEHYTITDIALMDNSKQLPMSGDLFNELASYLGQTEFPDTVKVCFHFPTNYKGESKRCDNITADGIISDVENYTLSDGFMSNVTSRFDNGNNNGESNNCLGENCENALQRETTLDLNKGKENISVSLKSGLPVIAVGLFVIVATNIKFMT